MTYSNTPNTGDTLGSTKVPINTNFSLIQAAVSQDHNGMGTGVGVAGKHNVIHLVEQATEGQTTVTEAALYTKTGANGDIFSRSPSHVDPLPAGEYQLTTFHDASIANFGTNILTGLENHGWTMLPGGLIMQYGRLGFSGTGTKTLNFVMPFTVATFTPVINFSLDKAVGYILSVPLTPTISSFDVQITSVVGIVSAVYWTAIGKP